MLENRVLKFMREGQRGALSLVADPESSERTRRYWWKIALDFKRDIEQHRRQFQSTKKRRHTL